MKLKLLPLLIFLIAIPQGQGSLGRKVIVNSIPEGVCRIEVEYVSGEITHCTGSIIGEKVIKTAGHCLEDFTPLSVVCGNGDKRTDFVVERFPHYNQSEILRDEENRWQDHMLLKFERSLEATPFTLVDSKEQLVKLMPTLKECLMSGYGGFGNHLKKTGILNGTLFSSDFLEIKGGTIYAKGKYFFELIPGDSGGALLCHDGKTWYDLGTASAHDWDNNSIYAANFAVQSWLDKHEVNHFAHSFSKPWPTLIAHAPIDIKLNHTYQLRSFSKITSESGESLYNGDNHYIEVEVTKISNDKVTGKLISSGASQYYLCEPGFICYQNGEVVTVDSEDLY